MSLLFDNPVQPVLKMSADPVKWQRSQSMIDPAARWRLYLHQLGLSSLMSWFQEEFEHSICPWPHAVPFDIWHAVEGISLTLGDTRLVVILSEAIDASEIKVPQEWVDMAGWAADYYLAAYVDVDRDQLILWGYATREQLKARGDYNAADRVYCLQDYDMVQDFSAFWVAQQINQPPEIATKPVPVLADAEAEGLLPMLADVPDPRRVLPFNQWAALIGNEYWRQRLYQQRQTNKLTSVADWLDNIFERGWQTPDQMSTLPQKANFRSAIASNAVLTCGKKILLNKVPDDLLLMFSVDIEADKRRNIRIQLYPSSESLLPSDLVLSLELPETGECLKTVKAGLRDDFIQIPPFRCSAGQRLKVHIQLDDSACQEEFIS